ncbi:response regulator transcription factor [Chroococcidiopsis sp. CCMEE 29]|uniref:response regulator transcription factor n=1 Tax=Chroococcidiopsis sp. CCMEE 29 TaxID=155894 RepID=UPI002020B60C|nr:response regulator transcription factor [Chroococcidiopsis sp. CCMEE 29]
MTRVLVAAADSIVRVGLESIVRTSPELVVVGSSFNLATLAALIEERSPDVVLMELGLYDESGSEMVAIGALSGVAIVLLADDLQGDWTTEALRLGVRAVLSRSATAEEIVPTVVAAAAGLVVLHPKVFDSLLPVLPTNVRPFDSASPIQPLTPREIEVLGMLAEGLGNKIIARRLGISEHTVKFHVSSILTKLNASSRTEAVTLGARQGLIML